MALRAVLEFEMLMLLLRLLTFVFVLGTASVPAFSNAFCAKAVEELAQITLPSTPISTLTLKGVYEAPLRAFHRLVSEYAAPEPLAAAMVFTNEGARAFSAFLLKEDKAEQKIAEFLKTSGQDPVELGRIFPRAAQDPVLIDFVMSQEHFYRQLFCDPEMRAAVAHSPYFIPGMVHALSQNFDEANFCFIYLVQGWPLEMQGRAGQYFGTAFRDPSLLATFTDFVVGRNHLEFRTQNSSHSTSGTTLKFYVEALSNSLTYENLEDLNSQIMRVYEKHFKAITVAVNGSSISFHQLLLSKFGASFQMGLNLFLKGMDESGNAAIAVGIQQLRGLGLNIDRSKEMKILSGFHAAAADPLASKLTLGQFAQLGQLAPESLFLSLLGPNFPTQDINGLTVPALAGRPQQIQMVKDVIQYATTTPRQSKLLEIGYGNPAALAVLKTYLPGVEMVGVDTVPPSPEVQKFVKEKMGIHLVHGNPPTDSSVAADLAKRGPYAAIFGVDVFRHSYGGNGPDIVLGSHQSYLQWVNNSLEAGGVFIILNDNRAPPSFSKEEFQKAGFSVVRWAESRSLPEMQTAIFSAKGSPDIGQMSLFVLRKGKIPKELPREFRETPRRASPP